MNSLKKHSFLFPFCLLKNWGDCLSCGGRGGMSIYVPIKRYSLFSFFLIQNFKRWQGGWFWSYFFRVIFFWWGEVLSPGSRVQCTVQSRFRIFPKDDMTSRQGDTTEQDDMTRRQDDMTSRQDIFWHLFWYFQIKPYDTYIQEHPTEYDVQKTLKLHKILIKIE